jgi:integrase
MVPDQPQGPPVQLQHSLGHIDCPACNAARDRILAPTAFAKLKFKQAAPTWLAEHGREISAKTYRDYEYYLRGLTRWFGELTLDGIHIGHIESYQEWRQHPHPEFKLKGAKASCINHEISTLAQVLARSGLWAELKKLYKPLTLAKARVGKALEMNEEERLWKVAEMSPRWKVAYWASLLSAKTTTDASEIRHLHVNEVDLLRNTISIREGTKNNFRMREVPLNAKARWAMMQIVERYYRECRRHKVEPSDEHYLLFARAKAGSGRRKGPPQFDKPMSSWRTAWRSIRKKAGLPKFRFKDLRHHAITTMLENPEISEETVKKVAGQVSQKILDTYSHIRIEAKREAVATLEKKRRKPVETDEQNGGETPTSVKWKQ